MQAGEYLQHLQEREYARIGKQPYNMADFLRRNSDRLADQLAKRQKPRSPGEMGIPQGAAASYLRDLNVANLPTPYENPMAYAIMAGATVDIEKSVKEVFGWKYPNKPTMGTLPLGRVNACAIRVPFTEQYIIVFQENLFAFVNLCAKAVAAVIPSDGSVQPATFSYEVAEIDKIVASDPVASQRFTEMLSSYLLEGRPHANGQYILVQPNRTYAEILIQAAELFALGHEHAHFISGDLTQETSEMFDEPARVDAIPFSWRQEFEADRVGAMLTIHAMKRRGFDLPFGYLGADFFCSAMDIVEQAIGIFRPEPFSASGSPSHPSWQKRRSSLRQALSDGVGIDGAKIALVVARSIEHIVQKLWTEARHALMESERAGIKLSPIWNSD